MPDTPTPHPIGTPGQPWGEAERAQWRTRQTRRRSYADDVLQPVADILQASGHCQRVAYGELVYGSERWPLQALRSADWQPDLPSVLVTGGVHGYETSGVLGALQFARQHAAEWAGRVNLLVVPCVSPWAYERIHRWNADAVDPNRSFRTPQRGQPWAAQESAALWRLVTHEPHGPGGFVAHIDLHETTDTDETEYRPALAARDGKPFVAGTIPDGFYVVDDTENPQPAFQAAIVAAVAQVTHIAPADERGEIIGSPAVAPSARNG